MKTALVTGASEGIGRAFAIRLSQEGYAVTAVARNEHRLKELAIEAPGLKYLSADLTTADGISRVASLVKEDRFDLLVNNAGMGVFGPFHAVPEDSNRKVMSLNCTAMVELSHAFLSVAKSGDALINVSSGAGYLPLPWSSLYTGTKAFVSAFTESLWYEQRRRGIYVLALCPGGTHSKFHARAGGDESKLAPLFMQTLALKALRRRSQPVVICGLQKPLIVVLRFVPRKWAIVVSSWFSELAETHREPKGKASGEALGS